MRLDGSSAGAAPLILTLRFDEAHQSRFDALREAHFPPQRNFLSAHVTLFHKLPGEEIAAIAAHLAELARETPAPDIAVEAPFLLGGGVAFWLVSTAVDALRREVVDKWSARLSPQDLTKGRLHVTVQNKVRPAEAKALHAELSSAFAPSRFTSPGLDLWRYRGGPWNHASGFEFAAVSAPSPARGRG